MYGIPYLAMSIGRFIKLAFPPRLTTSPLLVPPDAWPCVLGCFATQPFHGPPRFAPHLISNIIVTVCPRFTQKSNRILQQEGSLTPATAAVSRVQALRANAHKITITF